MGEWPRRCSPHLGQFYKQLRVWYGDKVPLEKLIELTTAPRGTDLLRPDLGGLSEDSLLSQRQRAILALCLKRQFGETPDPDDLRVIEATLTKSGVEIPLDGGSPAEIQGLVGLLYRLARDPALINDLSEEDAPLLMMAAKTMGSDRDIPRFLGFSTKKETW